MTEPTTDQQDSPSTPPSQSPKTTPAAGVVAPGLQMLGGKARQIRSAMTAPVSPPAFSSAHDDAGPADPFDGAPPAASTTTRSASSSTVQLGKAELHEIARGFVGAAGEMLHLYLARTPEDKAADLWLTTDDEDEGMGDPLADIVHRRLGNLAGSPDVVNLIQAGAVLAGYTLRHVKAKVSIWRAKRSLHLPDLKEPGAEGGDQ